MSEAPPENPAPVDSPPAQPVELPAVGSVVSYTVGDAAPVFALVVGHTDHGHALVFSLASVQGCASFAPEDLTL